MLKPALSALALLCPFLPHAAGQSVISARSGLVNYFEGVVFLDGQPLARRPGTFARMGEGSTLLTQSGRAEVLLTPDTYLRIGENSGIRMISGDIDDTRVELLGGSSILDSARAPEGAFVRIVFQDATIRIMKPGHYRLDADPPQLRVFEGEAEVTRNGSPVTIESSQLMPLDGAPVVRRFTQGSDGLLDLWSEERGSLIASSMANAQSVGDPLLDTGPGVPADLASYIGYMPIANAGLYPYGFNPYGYNPYGYSYPDPGFLPYPGLGILTFSPLRPASYLYVPRSGYTSSYPGRTRFPGGVGVASPPRPIFVPRPITPVMTAPRVGATGGRPGMRAVGRR